MTTDTKWNIQTRQQLIEDLYDTCRQDGEILEVILDEYVYLLKDNTERLDELKSWSDEVLGSDYNPEYDAASYT